MEKKKNNLIWTKKKEQRGPFPQALRTHHPLFISKSMKKGSFHPYKPHVSRDLHYFYFLKFTTSNIQLNLPPRYIVKYSEYLYGKSAATADGMRNKRERESI